VLPPSIVYTFPLECKASECYVKIMSASHIYSTNIKICLKYFKIHPLQTTKMVLSLMVDNSPIMTNTFFVMKQYFPPLPFSFDSLCDVQYRHMIFVNVEPALCEDHKVLAVHCHMPCLCMA
jgi:hypothetical protein